LILKMRALNPSKNVKRYWSNDMASHPRKTEYSVKMLWEHHISCKAHFEPQSELGTEPKKKYATWNVTKRQLTELAEQTERLEAHQNEDMRLTQISFILLHGLSQVKLIAVILTYPHQRDTLCGQGWVAYTLPILLMALALFYGHLYSLTGQEIASFI
jgi:hypothetical protein